MGTLRTIVRGGSRCDRMCRVSSRVPRDDGRCSLRANLCAVNTIIASRRNVPGDELVALVLRVTLEEWTRRRGPIR